MDWSQSRVLVTGATGMIGSWLVKRLLEEQAYVVALIRDWDPQSELLRSGAVNQISAVSGDLRNFADVDRAINEHEVDSVFHLGAQTIVGTAYRNPRATFESNVRGTYNLLEACRIHSRLVKRVVVASSDKVYGEAKRLPYTEEMRLKGRYPYDVSKVCAELLASSYAHSYDLPVTVARCGNVYGGGDLNWSRIVPGTIRSALEGRAPVLRSDGLHTRDFTYVLDIVQAYMLLGSRTPEPDIRGEVFNFSYERPTTVLEVTSSILELMERSDLQPVILDETRTEIRDQHLDSSKSNQALGWYPEHGLREGLVSTIRWYRDFFSGNGQPAAVV